MNILAPGLSIFIGNTIYSVRTICLTSMVTQKETAPNSFPHFLYFLNSSSVIQQCALALFGFNGCVVLHQMKRLKFSNVYSVHSCEIGSLCHKQTLCSTCLYFGKVICDDPR